MKEDILAQTVFSKCPELLLLYKTQGNKNLAEYLTKETTHSFHNKKKEEVISVIKKLAQEYISIEAGIQAEETLRDNFSASTADHHGVLCHPFTIHSLLLKKVFLKKPIVMLPCASVSLDNSSFPRGIFWHTNTSIEKITFHPDKHKHMTVFSAPSVPYEHLISTYVHTSETQKQILGFLKDIWEQRDSFKKQVSAITYLLSKKIAQQNAPFICIDQETVVLSLLKQFHIGKDTLINTLLTDTQWHQSFAYFFKNKRGAFSEEKGTFFFWYIDQRTKKRKRLFLKKDSLETATGDQIPLTEKGLSLAIEEGKLMPSMALSFIILSFYYGLSTPGGFLQIQYLGELKNAWGALLEKHGVSPPDHFSQIITNSMGADFGFLFQNDTETPKKLATLIDIILKIPDSFEQEKWVYHIGTSTTVKEGIDGMMKEYYKILTGGHTINHVEKEY